MRYLQQKLDDALIKVDSLVSENAQLKRQLAATVPKKGATAAMGLSSDTVPLLQVTSDDEVRECDDERRQCDEESKHTDEGREYNDEGKEHEGDQKDCNDEGREREGDQKDCDDEGRECDDDNTDYYDYVWSQHVGEGSGRPHDGSNLDKSRDVHRKCNFM